MDYEFKNYVGGEWVAGSSKHSLSVLDKYSQQPLATLTLADSLQIEAAIVAASRALSEYRTWSAGRRSALLQELANKIEQHKEKFLDLLIRECGKPRSYANSELDRCGMTLQAAARECLSFRGEMVPMDYASGEGKTAYTKRFPVGVVLCITPFNFPLNLVLHKIAPALAVGCAVILKPAPQSPLSAFLLAELLDSLGLPKGMVNVVACGIEEAESMVKDERIAMISFTGSEKVGWHLKDICRRKKIALELGGNAAALIDEGCDLAHVAKLLASASCIFAGQSCISTQRIFVVGKLFDPFKELLKNEFQNLVTGNPKDAKTIVGPVIDAAHVARIHSWVEEAIAGGAKILAGGSVIDKTHQIYAPTLLTNTQTSMKVVSEEIFGPVAVLEKVESFEAGLQRINDSKYGLQAGIFTNDIEKIKLAHELLEVGGVIVNHPPGFRVDSMPYGGVKLSGLGREGLRYAMEEMTEPRLLVF